MEVERVNEMLANYREYSARCAFLKNEIEDLQSMLAALQQTVVEDTVSTTSVVTGMPRGTVTSDPTGRLAIMLASGYTPPHIQQIEEEIAALRAELNTKSATIRYVDSWLLALNEKQGFILRRKAVDSLQWREIIYLYNKEFGVEYSRNGVKKIYHAALNKVYKVAGCPRPKSGRKVSE